MYTGATMSICRTRAFQFQNPSLSQISVVGACDNRIDVQLATVFAGSRMENREDSIAVPVVWTLFVALGTT